MGFLNNILNLENNEFKMKNDQREEFYQEHVHNCLKKNQDFMY
ncbi:hypothetical protein [Halonatronomonas betaini]|nr:hypothetical protein [Halonatronomonas betaini]